MAMDGGASSDGSRWHPSRRETRAVGAWPPRFGVSAAGEGVTYNGPFRRRPHGSPAASSSRPPAGIVPLLWERLCSWPRKN